MNFKEINFHPTPLIFWDRTSIIFRSGKWCSNPLNEKLILIQFVNGTCASLFKKDIKNGNIFKDGESGVFTLSEHFYLQANIEGRPYKTFRKKNKEQFEYLKRISKRILELRVVVVNFSNGTSTRLFFKEDLVYDCENK